ncbi:MAG: hypothetical protein ACP5HM_05815 [Anaerolineae bacterium]
MAIPPPPKRKERKAAQYVEALIGRVLADPSLGVQSKRSARRFAQALVLAALFTEGERDLFVRLYEQRASLTDRRREAEIQALCEEQGKLHLCDVINHLFSEDAEGREMLHFIARAIRDDLWQPIAEEIAERRFRRDHFLWTKTR